MDNVERLSPSSISTYLQCPRKFQYQKIEKRPFLPTEATVRGNFVHDILERLFVFPAEDRTFNTARQAARESWNEEYKEKAIEVVGSEKETLNQFQWNAWWCIDRYFGLEDPTSFTPLHQEEWVRGNIGPAYIGGIIDRVDDAPDNQIDITDYKSGKKPGKPEWGIPYKLQVGIYGLLGEAAFGKTVNKTKLIYLGAKSGVVEYDFDDEAREFVEVTVTNVRNGIDERVAAEKFETKTSALCDWCDYKSECPAWTKT